MAQEDVIKSIVLKLKGDNKDLIKSLEEVMKQGTKINQSLARPNSDLMKTVRTMETLAKTMPKVMGQLPKGFEKMQSAIRDLAQKDLERVGKKVNDLFDIMQRRHDRIQQMMKSGSSQADIARESAKAARTGERFTTAADAFSRAQQSVPQGGLTGMMNNPVAMMTMAGVVASAIKLSGTPVALASQITTGRLESQIATRGIALNKLRNYYSGNLAESVYLNRNPQALGRAANAADKEATARTWGMMSDIGTSTLLGAAAGGIAGSAVPIVGNIGGALIGGAAGLARGVQSTGAASWLFGGKRSEFLAQRQQQLIDAQRESSDLNMYYERFRQTQGERNRFQRQTGLSSAQRYGLGEAARGQGFEEQEAYGVAGITGRLAASGPLRRQEIASRAMGLARTFGLSAEGGAGLLSAGMRATGGNAAKAEESLRKIFVSAVQEGMDNVQVLQQMAQAVQETADNSKVQVDMSKAYDLIFGGADKQQLTGMQADYMKQGQKFFSDLSTQTTMGTAAKESVIRKRLKQAGVDIAQPEVQAMISRMTGMSEEELASINQDAMFMGVTKGKGIKAPENISREANRIVMENAYGSRLKELDRDLKSGRITEDQYRASVGSLTSMFGGLGARSEVLMDVGGRFKTPAEMKTGAVQATPEAMKQAETVMGTKRDTVEARAEGARFKGEQEAERMQRQKITGAVVEEAAKAQKAAVPGLAAGVGDVNASAEQLKMAIDNFVKSLSGQGSTYSPSGPKGM